MTDKHHAGYVVTLASDLRDEDAQEVLSALRMIRGVLSVEPIMAGFDVHIATERARAEMRSRLLEAVCDL